MDSTYYLDYWFIGTVKFLVIVKKYHTAVTMFSYGIALGLQLVSYGNTYSNSMDQPGKIANSARGQLNKEIKYFHVRVCA